jgi:protein TonB
MRSGIGMKYSLTLSVLVHAALVAAVLLLGRAVTQERSVFFVELKSISVSPAPKGDPSAPTSKKPKALPPKKIAKPEKKSTPEVIKPTVIEEKPAIAPDLPEPESSYVVEPQAEESPVEAEPRDESYSLYGDDTEGDVAKGVSYGVEGATLSSGPEVSGNALLLQIRDAIQRELTYPPLARRRRLEGTVVAGFEIDHAGQPRGIEILESSGFSILDNEVVKIIQRAAPFPHMPERVEVPVSFRLVDRK